MTDSDYNPDGKTLHVMIGFLRHQLQTSKGYGPEDYVLMDDLLNFGQYLIEQIPEDEFREQFEAFRKSDLTRNYVRRSIFDPEYDKNDPAEKKIIEEEERFFARRKFRPRPA